MIISKGTIVTTYVPMLNSDEMKVVARVESETLLIRDGYGYERTVQADDCIPASDQDQAAYWKDRAIEAERSGYGVMPGKTPLRDAVAEDMSVSAAIARGHVVEVSFSDQNDVDVSGDEGIPPGRYVYFPEK